MEKAEQITHMLEVTAQWAKPAYKKVSQHLVHALTLGDFDAWCVAAIIFARSLTPQERISMTWAGLITLDAGQREAVTATLMGDHETLGAGMPQAPLFSQMDQAAFWADMAEPDELDAYCLASFSRMHPRRQSAFLAHVQRGQAA